MEKVNWKQFAILNGMSEDEFKNEIYNTCMSLMSMEMEKKSSAEMSINNGEYVLSCKSIKWHKFITELTEHET